MAGVIAAHPFSANFEGDASLSRRPMQRVAEPLSYMGAQFEFEHGDGLPMTVRGSDLRSIDWNTGASSAQTKSAILLAGLVSGVEVRVTEKTRSPRGCCELWVSMSKPIAIRFACAPQGC